MDYGFAHQNKVFTPNNTNVEVEENDAHNKAIEKIQLALWVQQPDLLIAYIAQDADDFSVATTWLGTLLGRVIYQETKRNNFGHRETYLRVEGNNGAKYWGRYGSDWSQAIRLRKYKA